jgi:hypothetical protein
MTELEAVVKKALQDRTVRTTRIGGGGGGAAVSVGALLNAVRDPTRDEAEADLEARLDEAVKRLHGQRINYADSAGYLWQLRRVFGRSVERPEDVYTFPQSLVPPPYDEPF